LKAKVPKYYYNTCFGKQNESACDLKVERDSSVEKPWSVQLKKNLIEPIVSWEKMLIWFVSMFC
jgi:hypothetical protein